MCSLWGGVCVCVCVCVCVKGGKYPDFHLGKAILGVTLTALGLQLGSTDQVKIIQWLNQPEPSTAWGNNIRERQAYSSRSSDLEFYFWQDCGLHFLWTWISPFVTKRPMCVITEWKMWKIFLPLGLWAVSVWYNMRFLRVRGMYGESEYHFPGAAGMGVIVIFAPQSHMEVREAYLKWRCFPQQSSLPVWLEAWVQGLSWPGPAASPLQLIPRYPVWPPGWKPPWLSRHPQRLLSLCNLILLQAEGQVFESRSQEIPGTRSLRTKDSETQTMLACGGSLAPSPGERFL